MKKSPTKKLWEKITKKEPWLAFAINPDKMLKNYSTEKQGLDLVSSLILDQEKNKPGKRKPFSKLTKEKTLEHQKNKCKKCGKKSAVWDFDHKDGKKSNNDVSNCQALCPNCHAKKTRKKNSGDKSLLSFFKKIFQFQFR